MVLVWCTGFLFPEALYSQELFFSLFIPLCDFEVRRLQYHDMVTNSRQGNAFPTSIPQKSSTCPPHCAKKKQPSDSAEEDGSGSDGGGGGRGWQSMLGRAELEDVHVLKDIAEIGEVRGGERSFLRSSLN